MKKRVKNVKRGFSPSLTQEDQHKATFHHYLHSIRKPILAPVTTPNLEGSFGVFDDSLDVADSFELVEQVNEWYYSLPQRARTMFNTPFQAWSIVPTLSKDELAQLGLAPAGSAPVEQGKAGAGSSPTLDINRPTDTASESVKKGDD